MDEYLIEKWNAKVQPGDLVYHLGDFAWRHTPKHVERLNGDIVLILGNHDSDAKNNKSCFRAVLRYEEFRIPNTKNIIVMSHYCHRVWNKSHFNSIHLYGHSHGTLPPIGKSWDVGVDNNNYEPLSLDEVLKIMESRPDNPNLIKKTKQFGKVKESKDDGQLPLEGI